MSEKHTLKYFQSDGSFISFRESLAGFAPTQEETTSLKGLIEGVLGRETTPEFDDTISYLVTLLRNKAFAHSTSTSVTTVQKELSELERQLDSLRTFLDSALSDSSHNHLTIEMARWMGETNSPDPLYSIYSNSKDVLELCKTTRARIKGKRSDFTPNDMRQTLAEEVARELNEMGVEPTKYRDGAYAKIVRFVLEAIPCTVQGTRISISIPSDLFKVICDAIDVYKAKPRYSLLNIG